ncbi:MAG: DNA-processing protein DprA [Dehalobacterium sp.]
MEEKELKYLLALYHLPGMGQRHLKILVDYYQSFEYAWQQSDFWPGIPGFTIGHGEVPGKNSSESQAERLWEKFYQSDARAVTLYDQGYPQLLKNIYDPPFVIFYRGSLPQDEDITVAMVGSRKATAYGRLMAETLSKGLAEKDVWVVSGMARGIDTWSHHGCLEAGGKTVAVLGSGIDVIYPRENRGLYEKIIASGAVVSEFPLGSPPLSQHFPARNRIISGLSRGVLVVEAAEKSGSLITVDFALEQGRDVFAVPGPVTSPLSRGTHKLIRQGAKLVEKAEDILEEYIIEEYNVGYNEGYIGKNSFDLFSFTQEERNILEMLVTGSVHFDDLVLQSGLNAAEMAALLTQWEIKGLVKQIPGKYYIIGSVIS